MRRSENKKRVLWQFPWHYKESFIFASGFLITGYLLQIILGSVHAPVFPVNVIMLLVFIALICIVYFSGSATNIVKWLRSVPLSIASISLVLFQGIIMGVMPQNPESPHKDILGFTNVLQSWPFAFSIILLLFNLGLATLHRAFPFRKRNITFLVNHLGLWITLAAGIAGAGDLKRYEMDLKEGEVAWMANDGKQVFEMPFAFQLDKFEMEEYTPKITVANIRTNEVTTKGENMMRQIVEGDAYKIASREIKILKYYPEANSIAGRYEKVNGFGSSPAALIKCSTPGMPDTTAWISCGSFASEPSFLRLNDSMALVMMEPEPKSFCSHVVVYEPQKKPEKAVVEVNKPLTVNGWKIYQMRYDSQMGKYSTKSTLEVIKDPWLPIVYAGIFMMIIGSVLLIFKKQPNTSN